MLNGFIKAFLEQPTRICPSVPVFIHFAEACVALLVCCFRTKAVEFVHVWICLAVWHLHRCCPFSSRTSLWMCSSNCIVWLAAVSMQAWAAILDKYLRYMRKPGEERWDLAAVRFMHQFSSAAVRFMHQFSSAAFARFFYFFHARQVCKQLLGECSLFGSMSNPQRLGPGLLRSLT